MAVCEGMLCRSVPLCSILLWVGRQQGSKTICHPAIKRQRLRLDERFIHKCCQTEGLKPGLQCDVTLTQHNAGCSINYAGIGSISNPVSRCVSVASYCEPGLTHDIMYFVRMRKVLTFYL